MAKAPEVAQRLELWNDLRTVDPKYTKPITGKSYRGDSPNPTYVILKLTEQLGPIGVNWGFNVVEDRVIEGMPHQIEVSKRVEYGADGATVLTRQADYQLVFEKYHQVQIEFWQMVHGERRTFTAFGGTPMLYRSKAGNWIMDEDAAKKSLTDAYTKAASWLGACADIFLGLYDGKYQAAAREREAEQHDPQPANSNPAPQDAAPPSTPPAKRQSSAPAGW